MRRHLLLSAAAVGIMVSSGLTYGQVPSERKDEPKKTEEPAKGGAQHGQETKERGHSAHEQMRSEGGQGIGREEKGREHHQAAEEKNPAASEENRSKAKEQNQEAREPSSEHNRAAERAKQERGSSKSSAETKPENSGAEKSRAEPNKSKSGTAAEKSKSGTAAENEENERSGTAAKQNERNQKLPPGNSAERQPSEKDGNAPATASDTNRKSATDNQNGRSASDAQTNQANGTNDAQNNQRTRISSEKQVRISETLSRERLPPPERDLNISIRVGEAVPSGVRLHRLPPEIVSIEPEYRDYEYFSTDDDIIIVEPGSHRIVSEVPRDPSRARAQLSGGSAAAPGGTVTASSGNVDCKVMRRDASGKVAEVSTSTVGSSSRRDSLSVTIELPGGGSSGPIPLGAPAGDIVVATQGQVDCTVTLEPQTR